MTLGMLIPSNDVASISSIAYLIDGRAIRTLQLILFVFHLDVDVNASRHFQS